MEDYLAWGGFPEIVLADEALRPLILEEYASLMFYNDVIERYGVRNEKLMRELLRHAFRNTAGLINVSKLHRDFGSLGFSVSKNTLFEYLGYLEMRRTRKDLSNYINGSEVDLCDGEGTYFINICWNLAEAETRRRESGAMALGHTRWPHAQVLHLYHKYIPGVEKDIPEAGPAWRFLVSHSP